MTETETTPILGTALRADGAASELLSSARLLVNLAKAMARVQRNRIRPRAKGKEHRV